MPKYRAYGVVTGTKYLGEFEADSAEEAEEKALDSDEAHVSVCIHCSNEIDDPGIDEIITEEVED